MFGTMTTRQKSLAMAWSSRSSRHDTAGWFLGSIFRSVLDRIAVST
jgi:hypothetical protein